MSRISIVVPVYNAEPYLRACVDSIIHQTYQDMEIILVDDGSPDNSGKICDEYAAKDERVQVIHKENGGAASARAEGMARATGKWLTFIDADDWWDLDYLETVMKLLADSETDVLFVGGMIYEDSPYPEKKGQFVLEPFVFETEEEIRALARRVLTRAEPVEHIAPNIAPQSQCDKIYRMDFLRAYDIGFCPDIKIGEDIYFNWQVFSRAHKVVGSPYIGYHYRYVPSSTTHVYNPHKFEDSKSYINKLFQDYEAQENINDLPVEIIYSVVIWEVGVSLRNGLLSPDNPCSRSEKRKEYQKLRNDPMVVQAVRSKDNRYLIGRQIAIKYLLRQPWIWPVELGWALYFNYKKFIAHSAVE